MNNQVTCAEFEILLADFLDGTLAGEPKHGFERHQASCAACAELARDASGAVAFIQRVPDVVPPPEMVSRILSATSGPSRNIGQWFKQCLGAISQPQFAMGVALALLSFAMAARFWPGASDGVQRAWDRTIQGYENMQLVYQVQSQLQDWASDRPDGESK